MLFYLLGDLKDEEKKQVDEHMASCGECSIAMKEMKMTLAVIDKEKEMEVGPFIFTRIEQSLDDLRNENTIHSISWILKPVYITLIIIVAAFIGMFVGNNLKLIQNTKTTSTLYSITATKDFYILGVDDNSY